MSVEDKAREAYEASLILANTPEEERNMGLEAIAESIRKNASMLLEANKKDVEAGEKLLAQGKLSKALLDRLKISEKKIQGIIESVLSVAGLEDPVGKLLSETELDEGLILKKVSVPIGVIGAVFESRPDVVPQIASLCLKTGNSVIFKGGSEAGHSNRAFFRVIKEATEAGGLIPDGWVQMIETRAEVSEILKLDKYVSLMVPRGSNRFVQYIMENTRIPVLGHADGVCHVYVDDCADLDMAEEIIVDAKTQYPAVCNAAETLLVSGKVVADFLPKACATLKEKGVELRGDEKTRAIVEDVLKASEEDWVSEYNDLILSVKVVDGIRDAVHHINCYGSHHTDCIVTGDDKNAEYFLKNVDSACVFRNCSTRFSDGFRFGLGAEVGISTNKIHARGPVGLDGLVIYKWVLEGSGHTVREYAEGKRKFTHKKLK